MPGVLQPPGFHLDYTFQASPARATGCSHTCQAAQKYFPAVICHLFMQGKKSTRGAGAGGRPSVQGSANLGNLRPIPGSALSLCNHPFGAAASSGGGPGCRGLAPRCPPSPGSWEMPRLPIHAAGSCPGGRLRFLSLSRGWETHGREGRGGPGEIRENKAAGRGCGRSRAGWPPAGFPRFFFFPGKGVFRVLPVACGFAEALGGLWRAKSSPAHPAGRSLPAEFESGEAEAQEGSSGSREQPREGLRRPGEGTEAQRGDVGRQSPGEDAQSSGSPREPLPSGRAGEGAGEPGLPHACRAGCPDTSPSPFPVPAATGLLSKTPTTPPDIPLAVPFPNIFLSSSSPFHRSRCCWPGLCFPR